MGIWVNDWSQLCTDCPIWFLQFKTKRPYGVKRHQDTFSIVIMDYCWQEWCRSFHHEAYTGDVKIYILKYRNKIILKSKDSESIEGVPIIIEYRFTVVTTNDILLYDMINIMFLNMMVSF